MRRCGVAATGKMRWIASGEMWFGLMLTEGQQEPVVYASVVVCEEASKGTAELM